MDFVNDHLGALMPSRAKGRRRERRTMQASRATKQDKKNNKIALPYLDALGFCAGLIGAAALSACSPKEGLLAPTPTMFAAPQNQAMVASTEPANASDDFSLLYITDRAKIVDPQTGAFSYGSERSYTMSFGSIDVRVEPASDGTVGETKLSTIQEIGQFPEVPYPAKIAPGGYRRAPDVVAAHEEAVASLQSEIRRRLAKTKRKEVVVFIHGYNNTFNDAASATGNICRLLGQDFVCVVLTWPAGGKGGAFMGYNVDRESGEFAVSDMRKAIRAIGETPGLRGSISSRTAAAPTCWRRSFTCWASRPMFRAPRSPTL
jgi:esterase/lipase superfamily enzyme